MDLYIGNKFFTFVINLYRLLRRNSTFQSADDFPVRRVNQTSVYVCKIDACGFLGSMSHCGADDREVYAVGPGSAGPGMACGVGCKVAVCPCHGGKFVQQPVVVAQHASVSPVCCLAVSVLQDGEHV